MIPPSNMCCTNLENSKLDLYKRSLILRGSMQSNAKVMENVCAEPNSYSLGRPFYYQFVMETANLCVFLKKKSSSSQCFINAVIQHQGSQGIP